MNTYDDSSMLSGRKGAALSAVVVLHLAFGFALYSELAQQIRRTLEAPPLALRPLTQPMQQTIKPLSGAPPNESVRLHVVPPELPPLTAAEPEAPGEVPSFESAPAVPPSPSPLGASSGVRMDPKHPLRIGEAYYPDASRRANETGRCLVKVTVASDGRIAAATLQSSTGFSRLDQACLNAVRGQRMLPAIEDGKAVESSVSLPIVWNLFDR